MTNLRQQPLNPQRYRPWLLFLLTLCLLFAEHHSARDMHGGIIERDFISAERSGQLPRQIAYLIIGGLGALGLRQAWQRRRMPLAWNHGIAVSLGALLGWCALSVGWSDTPAITVRRLFVVFLMLLGSVGMALCWTEREMLSFIAVSGALQVAVGIGAEIVFGFFTPWQSDYRFGGTLHWNQQGYLCMVAALAAFCLSGRNMPHAWRYRLLVGFGLTFMLLTRSRGSLIGLAVALALYLLLVLQPVGRVAASLIGAALLSFLLLTGAADKALDVLNRGGEGSENLTGRAPLWDELMTYVHKRPLLGYGYEGFWTENTIDDVSNHQGWSIDAAHSGYVESMLTLGYIGMALHTQALLIAAMEAARRYLRTRRLIFYLAAALCLIYLVGGYLEAILIVKPSPISFFLSLLLFATMMQKQPVRVPSARPQARRDEWPADGSEGWARG